MDNFMDDEIEDLTADAKYLGSADPKAGELLAGSWPIDSDVLPYAEEDGDEGYSDDEEGDDTEALVYTGDDAQDDDDDEDYYDGDDDYDDDEDE